jgi:hypothetical protein
MMNDRRAITLDGVTYAPGAAFRVTARARLSGLKSEGRSSWGGWSQDLRPGDIVLCTGHGPGWGSDPGYGVEFSTPQSLADGASYCEITPSAGTIWNSRPHPGLLEPVRPGEGTS